MGIRARDLRIEPILRGLRPRLLLASITAGLLIAVIDIPIEVSCAVLLFSGTLSGYVSSGAGLLLLGAVAFAFVTALTSSYRGMVGLPQDSPAAVLALVTAATVGAMPLQATPQAAFITVVAALATTTLLSAFLFLVLGWFRLGSLIRYIPHPVIGGFLAGSGWLLVSGAIGAMIGRPFHFSQIASLFQVGLLVKWLPALLFGVLLLVVLRHHHHSWILPVMLAAAIGLFYLLLGLTGTSLVEARAQGWLLGPFSARALWPPFFASSLRLVYWPAIVGQGGNVATVLLICVVSLLLTTSALELIFRRDLDLNRELKSAGLANLVAGLVGSPVGYQSLSLTALGHRMGADSRMVGIVTGLVCGAMLFAGAPLLSYCPKPVLGALLSFLGLAFLVEWVYDAWFELSKVEYGIVLLILIAMSTVGIMVGLGLGLTLAVALFIVRYSRVPVVKHALAGGYYRSNVDRPWPQSELLRKLGHQLHVLELQGFLFFGTADGLLDQVRQRLKHPRLPCPRFVVLDFRQVSGLDASAELSFARMMQVAGTVPMVLVFTSLSPKMQRQLSRKALTDEDSALWHVDVDLDHGLEWCEEQILRSAISEGLSPEPEPAEGPGEGTRLPSVPLTSLIQVMERKEVEAGRTLIRQGDSPQGLYFIEAGQVTAQRECEDGSVIRLRKMGPGSIVGEMGLYLGITASASVVTDQASTVYFLSAEAMEHMEETAPTLAAALHRYVAQLLGERLARANDTLQVLLGGPEPSLVAGAEVSGDRDRL